MVCSLPVACLFRNHGYEVFPVHPNAETLHGDPCYPNLGAIPGGVDAVFIMNSPDISEKIAYEAASLGIRRIWMHNNTLMPSSVSEAAVAHCRTAGMNVIAVGCPMMFLELDIFIIVGLTQLREKLSGFRLISFLEIG